MRLSRRTMLFSAAASLLARRAGAQEPPFFTFHNRFWLNLHHFLYVLGRARNNTSDSQRGAVIGAITDGNPLETLSAPIELYRQSVSAKDLIFDRPLAALTRRIAAIDDNDTLPDDLALSVLGALLSAAPAYRRDWWPRHSVSNRARIDEVQALVNRYGSTMAPELARYWMNQWPASGFDVQVAAYANWGGAYSTSGGLIVFSSTDPASSGSQGLEIVFHEAMHQWGDDLDARTGRIARSLDVRVPPQFSHSLIFYTAGYVVAKTVPDHQPYATKNSLWNRGMLPLEDLDRHWRPYLEGKITLDDALGNLLASGKR